MSISNTNYRETYFLKPDLSPIIGKPTFESLYQLIVDLQAINMVSFLSDE